MNADPTHRPRCVVKLGGSLNDDPARPAGLALLATRSTARIAAGSPLIWRPIDVVLEPHGIVPGRDITADSLAWWLVTRLGAHGRLPVRSSPIDPSMDWDARADHELVDRRFPSLAAALPARIEPVHRSALAWAERLLGGRSDA